jgi:hypothetical protein
MTDRELTLLLTGAAIALVSSLVVILLQHFLSMTADMAKRDRAGKQKPSSPSFLVAIKARREREERAKRDRDRQAGVGLWDWWAKLKAGLARTDGARRDDSHGQAGPPDWLEKVKAGAQPEPQEQAAADKQGGIGHRFLQWLDGE